MATHPLRFGGESGERRARLIRHPEASLRGREPSGDPRRERVHTREQRLRLRCRRELFERRLMLPATGVQHARRHVQKHRGGRVDVWLGDLPGAAQPALSLVELAHPDRHAANRPKRGREYRPIVQAMALGQGHRLTAALACGRDRDEP